MPVQAMRPRPARMARQAALKAPSMRAATASSPSRSIASTRRPLAAKSWASMRTGGAGGTRGFR